MKIGKLYETRMAIYVNIVGIDDDICRMESGEIVLLLEYDEYEHTAAFLVGEKTYTKSWYQFSQWDLKDTWNDFFREIKT